jgi:hypothetical protein
MLGLLENPRHLPGRRRVDDWVLQDCLGFKSAYNQCVIAEGINDGKVFDFADGYIRRDEDTVVAAWYLLGSTAAQVRDRERAVWPNFLDDIEEIGSIGEVYAKRIAEPVQRRRTE